MSAPKQPGLKILFSGVIKVILTFSPLPSASSMSGLAGLDNANAPNPLVPTAPTRVRPSSMFSVEQETGDAKPGSSSKCRDNNYQQLQTSFGSSLDFWNL